MALKKSKKIVTAAVFVFSICLFVIALKFTHNERLRNHISASAANEMKLNEIYIAGFDLSEMPSGRINTYYPRYKLTELSSAQYYSEIFGISENFVEEEDYYAYENELGRLTIYKHVSRVSFVKGQFPGIHEKARISDQEAITIALDFAEDNLLSFQYEEVLIEFEDGVFYLSFINRLGNLKNFGFANTVRLDGEGNVLSLDYYYISYEKLNGFLVKSKWAAFNELTLDFDQGTEILLDSCQLVYIYENSIVQPAYLFRGKINDGRFLESFVKAAQFSSE